MLTPEELAARLPPPRDDEPASLRQDILDELADHLQCALERELFAACHGRSPGENTAGDVRGQRDAEQRVLERFGNPSAIAWRLWWDLMWEKVMSQRLMLAASLMMAVACVAMLGLFYRAVGVQTRFFERQQEQTELLIAQIRADSDRIAAAAADREEELRRMNVSLATQLENSTQTVQTIFEESRRVSDDALKRIAALEQTGQESSDWNPAEFKLVTGTEDGPPAVGFTLRMSITARETGIPPMSQTSGADGIVTFPRVRYGTYTVRVSAPWREHHSRTITLSPGQGLSETILCPAQEPDPQPVTFEVEWPEDLRAKPVMTSLSTAPLFREVQGSRWTRAFRQPSRSAWTALAEGLFIDPSGQLFGQRTASESLRALDVQFDESGDGRYVLVWPGSDYRFDSSVTFLLPRAASAWEAFRETGRVPERTMLSGISVEPTPERPLFRLAPGAPGKLVIEPPDEVIELIRKQVEEDEAALAAGESLTRYGDAFLSLNAPRTPLDVDVSALRNATTSRASMPGLLQLVLPAAFGPVFD